MKPVRLFRFIHTKLFNSRPTLVTNSFFTNVQLKPRIQMLTGLPTNRYWVWKYALVIPLLAVLSGLTVSCDRVNESPTGKLGERWAVAGQVVDSRQEPIAGVTVYAQTPDGSFSTDPKGVIERTSGRTKTDQHGRYQLYGLDATDKVEFIHPAYLVTVLPVKKMAFNGQVRLFTMTEALKLVNDSKNR